MSVEAMKQALEALEKDSPWREETITSLRQAIAEAEKQEPVAWMIWLYGLAGLFEHKQLAELEFSRRNEEYPNEERKLVPLYTTPQPQREPPDDGFTQALIERDEYHAIADELAEMIAHITGEDIGEHTSANFPWRNALDAAENWLCHPTPQSQREWVGLTDEEIDALEKKSQNALHGIILADAKLKEKNT